MLTISTHFLGECVFPSSKRHTFPLGDRGDIYKMCLKPSYLSKPPQVPCTARPLAI